MSGVNELAGEGQGKMNHVVISKEKVAPLPNKKVEPSKKFTPSNDVEKGTNLLNGMEEPVVTTR